MATTWSRSIGLDVPIVNAPMGGAAGGRLAAAVSAAGGLGMIGMGSSATAEQLTAELAQLDERRFGIGLVHWVAQDRPDLFEVALAARPALLSVSFGDDWDWVRRAHDAGLTVTTQVATVDAARRAVDAGVDVLVARGAEGGGHGEPAIGTLPLLAEVLDTVDVPVLPPARDALLAAGSESTELTTEYDVAAGYRWPPSIPERVLRGSPVNAGQGVGRVTGSAGAAEIVRSLSEGAAQLLGRWR
ncbi:oxidoreductase, 2-nitropropane dioxygenase [Mycolicibacterium conceptionense]|uniref:Oxidoreductase, 2-nitropropane dioxygenase n=1 Tax=Mycolicibacterium conceptionense TaxID=451644 RepID=A0A0U1D3P9_9MYCO|nr:oxidoreductase, 2-nitropropane dioxygenase [Mycolicibacterium conceptionense]